MDLIVAGTPRSGSTMLASILTNSDEGQVVANEPRRDVSMKKEIRQAARWGVKHVRPAQIRAWSTMWKPPVGIVIVRDIRASISSYVERVGITPGIPPKRKRIMQKNRTQWVVDCSKYIAASVQSGELVPGVPVSLVLKYEYMVQNPEVAIKQIEAVTGWKCNGDPGHHHKRDNRLGGRQYEAERHEGVISAKSLDAWQDRKALPFEAEAAKECSEYQSVFGYERR